MAFVQLLSGFTSVGLVLLTKEMRFRPLFKIDAFGLTIDLLVAVSAAILWRSVWALVLGTHGRNHHQIGTFFHGSATSSSLDL